MTATTPRVLRADAERNLRRVLDAALEVFAEHGIDAPVTLIAERAGVGVATIFRRFPTKDDLLAALLAHRGEQLVAAADAALEREDPEAAFRELAELITATQIADRGFCDAIGTELFAREDLQKLFDGVRSRLVELLARAQASGRLPARRDRGGRALRPLRRRPHRPDGRRRSARDSGAAISRSRSTV